jgi:hypothetical protein
MISSVPRQQDDVSYNLQIIAYCSSFSLLIVCCSNNYKNSNLQLFFSILLPKSSCKYENNNKVDTAKEPH